MSSGRGRGVRKALLAISPFLGALLIWGLLAITLGSSSPIVVVTGRSMKPTLEQGDLLFVKAVDIGELHVGDIVVFHRPDTGELVVHRVYKIVRGPGGEILLKTKGDNNEEPDRWLVSKDELVGKVVYRLPAVGKVVLFVRENAPISIFLLAVLYGLFLSEFLRRPGKR